MRAALLVVGALALGPATSPLASSLSMLPPLEPNEALLARVVDDALIGSDLGEAGGLAVGVLHRGAAYRYARGFVDSDRRRKLASTKTPFRLASITKTMTAVVALQLVEEGALALEDTVGALLPAAPPPWRQITVRQLLTHTSGIPHHPPRGPGSFLNIHLDTEQTLRLIARSPLVAPPGERFTYSTYGYGVLGAIIERVERRPLRDILAERVTDPLGMTGTFIEDSRRRRPDWPVGWRVDRVRGGLLPSRRIDLSSREAGGGARGTVDDLLIFGEALLRHTLINAESFRAMTTPAELPDGTLVDYGLGVAVYPRRGLRVVAHAGGQSETTSLLFLAPALDLIVVAITNVEGQGQALSRIADAVVDVLVHDGAAVRDVSALDPADEAVAFVVRRAASWGLSEREGGSLGLIATPEAVDEAFRRFAALLDDNRVVATPDVVTNEARGLHHPRAHRVTPLVGLTVAQAVGDVTEAALGADYRGGLGLFARYVEVCEVDPARCPPPRRLSPSLEERLRRLDAVTQRLSTKAVLALRVRDVLRDGGVDDAEALLGPMVGASAHPDVVDELVRAADGLIPTRLPDALRVARLNVALHPRSPRALLSLAELVLLSDDGDAVDEAVLLLERASRVGSTAPLSATLWSRRILWLQRQPLPRASVAADVLRAFVLARVTSQSDAAADD